MVLTSGEGKRHVLGYVGSHFAKGSGDISAYVINAMSPTVARPPRVSARMEAIVSTEPAVIQECEHRRTVVVLNASVVGADVRERLGTTSIGIEQHESLRLAVLGGEHVDLLEHQVPEAVALRSRT
eukprot:9493572-Pyramimonas_sp.AAC.1